MAPPAPAAAKPSTNSHTSVNYSPRLLSLRLLVVLERFQAFYSSHPSARIAVLFTFGLIRTLAPSPDTPVYTAVSILSWGIVASLVTTRRIVVLGVVPLVLATAATLVFEGYKHVRGQSAVDPTEDEPAWGDQVAVALLVGVVAYVLDFWRCEQSVQIWKVAGVKGLLVRSWRQDFEGRMERVMDKHEASIKRFCAHMLDWMLIASLGHTGPPDKSPGSIAPNTSYAPTCAPCAARAADQGSAYPLCPRFEPPASLTHWTMPQLLLFRPSPSSRLCVTHTFSSMLNTAREALTGFNENACEIRQMEADVVQRMKHTSYDFGVLRRKDPESEAWCEREWATGFCNGRGEKLVKLTERLVSVWDHLSEEIIRDVEMWEVFDEQQNGKDERTPKVGDPLPKGIADAILWFLLVQGCAGEDRPGEVKAWERELEREQAKQSQET